MPRYAQLLIANELLASWFRDGMPRAVPTAGHLPPSTN